MGFQGNEVMPICTTCTTYTPYLYTVYESAYNLRLEQCSKCHAFADPYVEHDSLTILLDLILLKPGVYRHLLYNRGSPSRRANAGKCEKAEDTKNLVPCRRQDSSRTRERWIWTLKLGVGLITLDAFIRWTYLNPGRISQHSPWTSEIIQSFLRVLFGCLAETIAFHTGITIACIAILMLIRLLRRICGRNSPPSDIAREFKPSLIPLTLFYSSLTKLFLLFLLTIWLPTSSSPNSAQQTDWIEQAFMKPNATITSILSDMSQVLDDDKIDREWIVRNILGGMSAGFGLRVILDIHPLFSTFVILSGWAAKTAMAQFVGDWVGGDIQSSQAWLAYSIP